MSAKFATKLSKVRPLLALSRHCFVQRQCPLSGLKRTRHLSVVQSPPKGLPQQAICGAKILQILLPHLKGYQAPSDAASVTTQKLASSQKSRRFAAILDAGDCEVVHPSLYTVRATALRMKMGLGASLTRTRGVDELGGSVGASAGLTIEMVIAELAAAYEIARWNGLYFTDFKHCV